MIDEREPRRWSAPHSDAPEELRALLEGGRTHAPALGEVAALRQRLTLELGPEAGLGPQTSLLPAAPVASVRLQWLGRAAALAGGVGTAALLGLWLSSTPPTPDPGRTSSPAPASAPSSASAPPSATAPPVAVTTPATALPDSASLGASAPAPVPRTAHSERAPAASTPSEAELLRRAQAALAERPREALRLTAEHERRFARGALREEREVIAIEALRRLGQSQVAERRQAKFDRVYRGSVHRETLRNPAH